MTAYISPLMAMPVVHMAPRRCGDGSRSSYSSEGKFCAHENAKMKMERHSTIPEMDVYGGRSVGSNETGEAGSCDTGSTPMAKQAVASTMKRAPKLPIIEEN